MKKVVLFALVAVMVVSLTSCMSVAERKIYKKVSQVDEKLAEIEATQNQPKEVDGSLVKLPNGQIVPDFVLNPPRSDSGYFGVGYAKQSALNLSIQLAETRARADVANQVITSIEQVVQYYAKDEGINNPEALTEYMEVITRGVTQTTLVGMAVENRIPMEDGSVWVMVSLSMDKVKESLELSMKQASETAQSSDTMASMAEWKSQQAFKYLDDVMGTGDIYSIPVTE